MVNKSVKNKMLSVIGSWENAPQMEVEYCFEDIQIL